MTTHIRTPRWYKYAEEFLQAVKLKFPRHARDLAYAYRRVIEIGQGNVTFRVRQVSDTHHDAETFRYDLFKDFVQTQREDRQSVWIHSGDIPDSDRPTTREMKQRMFLDRKEAFSIEDRKNISWLEDTVIPMYKEIAASCIGILEGDHHLIFSNGSTSGEYLAWRLNIPYLGERSGWVHLAFKSGNGILQYNIHARHGKSRCSTPGGDMTALRKQEMRSFADLHLGGHTHQGNVHPERWEYVNGNSAIRQKICVYMRGGSFLDGFPLSGKKTYAYRAEYSPLPCGWGEVELKIGRLYHGEGKSRPQEIKHVKGSIIAA